LRPCQAPGNVMPDSLLLDTTTRIFEDLCDPRTVNAARDGQWKETLWEAIEQSGLTLAWVPEEHGGAGAGLGDGFEVLAVSGRFAVPVPLAETLLAGWLLAQAGLSCPSGPMTVAPSRLRDTVTVRGDGTLGGKAAAIPFAAAADTLVVLADRDGAATVARVDRSACTIRTSPGFRDDGRDLVELDGARPVELAPLGSGPDADCLALMGATVRAVQIGGALESVLALAGDYARERVAFERPIARFQAVQHNLARLAGETAAAVAAAGSAADTVATGTGGDDALFLEVASAKIRAGEAAGAGAAIAHQVHGAIGFTEEHVLHRFTRRLWAWRDDFGSESEWAVRLGRFVAANGADDLWPLLASR